MARTTTFPGRFEPYSIRNLAYLTENEGDSESVQEQIS